MLLEAEKRRSLARSLCQLIPDGVPRGGTGQRGGWARVAAVATALG